MTAYNPTHLRKIQEYRAVVELPPSRRYDSQVDQYLISLPTPILEQIVTHLRNDTDSLLPAVNVESQYNELANFALTNTDLPTPYPITFAAEAATSSHEAIRTGNTSCHETKALTSKAIAELSQNYHIAVTDLPQRAAVHTLIAKYAIEKMDSQHRETVKSRLSRIHDTDTPEPFETITSTEVAHCIANETMTNEKLVNPAGVGLSYGAFMGMLDEMGLEAEEMLPPGTLDREIPGSAATNETKSDESAAEPTTIRDLTETHQENRDDLRMNLKYIRDCFYLRELHEFVSRKIPYDPVSCPELTWKQAALDIQSNDDPLSVDVADDGDQSSIPIEKVTRTTPSNPDAAGGDSTSASTSTETQTGLSQF